MRLLADENFPHTVVKMLRYHNHDVLTINSDMGGSHDGAVLLRATDERRILLTLDNDFDELYNRKRLNAPFGVVLFRLPQNLLDKEQIMVEKLESRSDWPGHFSVIDETGIYMKLLMSNA